MMKTALRKVARSGAPNSAKLAAELLKPLRNGHGKTVAASKGLKLAVLPVINFLDKTGVTKIDVTYAKGETVFSQGDTADTIFCIQSGQVKITVVSSQGKEAIVGVLNPGDFVGDECISITHPVRLLTATALSD